MGCFERSEPLYHFTATVQVCRDKGAGRPTLRIAYISGPSGSGKSTFGELVASSKDIPCVRLDLVMKEALLYACPSFTGTKFCGGPDELSRETWKVLFKNSNLLPAFDHAYRAELHLEEVGPLPERLIIEGSQLVWPFWRDPLQPVFRSLFGRDCDWGLYLLKQTPDQLMKQIMMRNRPHEQVLDLEWIAKGASHYSDHFETVPSLWVHKDACQVDPALLRKRITEFLFQQ